MAAFDHDKVGFKSGTDALLDDFTDVFLRPDHDGGADELLRLVQNRAFRNEEAEAAVSFPASPFSSAIR